MPRIPVIMIALLPQALAAQPAHRVGEVHEIRIERNMEETSSNAGSGNSHDLDTMIERVIAVRDDGVELEFDLPADMAAENRAQVWQFPARVFHSREGALQLLNTADMETRVTRWLEAAHWTRAMCGRWIFTWNAFRIDCDPQSVLPGITAMELRPALLSDGAPYSDALSRETAALRREANGAAFVTELPVDPNEVRRQQAESEAASTEIMGDTPQLRAFRAARVPRQISGTIRVRFEADVAGRAVKRIRVIDLQIEQTDGVRVHRTITETIERRLIAPAGS